MILLPLQPTRLGQKPHERRGRSAAFRNAVEERGRHEVFVLQLSHRDEVLASKIFDQRVVRVVALGRALE